MPAPHDATRPRVEAFKQMRFSQTAPKWQALPPPDRVEIAFAGRSNAGKSSALNALCEQKNLARTSKTPGRTQAIVCFDAPGLRLVDLPGYGYANVPPAKRAGWQTLIERYLANRAPLATVVLIMDARRPLGDFDRQLVAWGRANGLTFYGLLTKADKLGRRQQIETHRRVVAATGGASVQLFSATQRIGVDEARRALVNLARAHAGLQSD